MATPVLSVEEGAAALLASFEIVAAAKRGSSAEKGDPLHGGTSITALAGPSPPLLPDLPSHPYLPKGANEPGNVASTIAPVN
jgi:hypothetical protein